MKPADKFLRLGVVASFAFLLLLVTVRSFMDGPEPSAAPQIAQAPAAQETPAEVALSEEAPAESAPAPQDAAPTQDVAAVEDAVEAESAEETTELAEVAPEQAAPVEAAIDDTGVTDWLTSSALLASADIDAGESAFRQCSACHQYASERNAGGPHLVGIVGRAVGSVENWRYSTALQEAGGIWTPERLNEWLINPDDYLPGNRMAYPGVRSEQERIDIIGFLAAQGQG
jgi:cytochrome c2